MSEFQEIRSKQALSTLLIVIFGSILIYFIFGLIPMKSFALGFLSSEMTIIWILSYRHYQTDFTPFMEGLRGLIRNLFLAFILYLCYAKDDLSFWPALIGVLIPKLNLLLVVLIKRKERSSGENNRVL